MVIRVPRKAARPISNHTLAISTKKDTRSLKFQTVKAKMAHPSKTRTRAPKSFFNCKSSVNSTKCR